MSVLIKGMDKETAMRLCSYAGIWMEEEDFIEIPPHGRLIDADEFEKYVELEYETREISHPNWIKFRVWCGDQPTVIEPEEEESDETD